MSIPQKVDRRILEGCKRYRPILEQGRARDVNESDTVTIVKGLLADVFGWDPFFEVTSEYSIRSTYCDLAVKTVTGRAKCTKRGRLKVYHPSARRIYTAAAKRLQGVASAGPAASAAAGR